MYTLALNRSRVLRLGDYIDDYCSRCQRALDHSVVSFSGEDVLKVRCRTCGYEHTYRKGPGGKKKEMTKQEAFNRVLAGITGASSLPPAEPAKAKKPRKRSS